MSTHIRGDAFEKACVNALAERWPKSVYIHTKLDSVHGIDFALRLEQGHIAIVEVKSATGSPTGSQMTSEWIRTRMLPLLRQEVVTAFRNRKKVFRATYRVFPKSNFVESDPESYTIRSAGPTGELHWSDLFPGEPEPISDNFQITSQSVETDSNKLTVTHHMRCGSLQQEHQYVILLRSISKAVYDGALEFKSFPFRIPHSHSVYESGRTVFTRGLSQWDSHLDSKSSLGSDNVEQKYCKRCKGVFYCTSGHIFCHVCYLSQSKQAQSEAIRLCNEVESLKHSTNWRETMLQMVAAQKEWKNIIGFCRQDRDELWPRFDKAVQYYFNARTAYHVEQKNKENENKEKAKTLITTSKALSATNDWKNGSIKAQELQAYWKQLGQLPKEDRDVLWNDFNSHITTFFRRKSEHYAELDLQRQKNMQHAQSIINDAISLSVSNDWKDTSQKLQGLQRKWKELGPLPKECQEKLWSTFNVNVQRFYERRQKHFEQVVIEERSNAALKRELVNRVGNLIYSNDPKEASIEVKHLQQKWRSIGRTSKQDTEKLWSDFRNNCDRVFAAYGAYKQRRQDEWNQRTTEALIRAREVAAKLESSIDHDEENINRWFNKISDLRAGGRARDIRQDLEQKIEMVKEKIYSKRQKLSDIYRSIRDMESKL